jgi:hypothetical protein
MNARLIATLALLIISGMFAVGCPGRPLRTVEYPPDRTGKEAWLAVTVGPSIKGPTEIFEHQSATYSIDVKSEVINPYQMSTIPMAPEPIWSVEPSNTGTFYRQVFLAGDVNKDTKIKIKVSVGDESRSLNVHLRNQPEVKGWWRTWPGGIDKVMSNVVIAGDGTIYAAGAIEGEVDVNPGPGENIISSAGEQMVHPAATTVLMQGSEASRTGFVSKFDPLGNFLSAFKVPYTSGEAYGVGEANLNIAVDSSGNVVIAHLQGFCKYDPSGNKLVDVFWPTGVYDGPVKKSDGSMDHVKCPTGVFSCAALGLATGPSDEIYLGGILNGPMDFDPSEREYQVGSNDDWAKAWLGKYGPDGSLIWVKSFGGAGSVRRNQIFDIATDNEGMVYVTGTCPPKVDLDPGPGEFLSGNAQNYLVFVSKFDPNGGFIWGGSWEGGNPLIALDTQGNLFSTCSIPLMNKMDIIVGKYDTNGHRIWSFQFGGDRRAFVTRTSVDRSGIFYLAGNFGGTFDFDPSSDIHEVQGPENSRDFFIECLSADGKFQWVKTWSGSGFDWYGCPIGFDVDSEGRCYLMGAFNKDTDIDPGPGFETLAPSRTTLTNHFSATPYPNDFFLLMLPHDGNFR